MELRAGQCSARIGWLGELGREFWAVWLSSVWGKRDDGETGKLQLVAEEKSKEGVFFFGSEVGVAVALACLCSVVASLSVAMPPVLPALPPTLMMVAPVTVGSSGCWGRQSRTERKGRKCIRER